MKLIFRFLGFFCCIFVCIFASAWGREIILVENLASPEEGQLLMRIIEDKFNIPLSIVSFQVKSECSKNNEAIMHLCLQKNGELEIVKINKFVVKNSLSVFYARDYEDQKEKRN